MKVLFAIAICKALYFAGSMVGKGSSLPGQIALKICPDALSKIKLPKNVIAVTGSNGKTSTSEFLAHALEQNGLKVSRNHEGSNQTEGAATLLLRVCSLRGVVKSDAVVLECDERYARKIFESVKPSALIVTNLCRDQLSRNGHFEFISDCISAAITAAGRGTRLVLNADDPYVSALAAKHPANEVTYFGVSKELESSAAPTSHPCYDDGAFCPICKSRMAYDYRVAGHYGSYKCSGCEFKRKPPDVEILNLDYDSGEITIAPSIKTHIAMPSLVGAYNLAATIAAASVADISSEQSAKALDNYHLKGGRTAPFNVEQRKGTLLIANHENSFAYNQSMNWAVHQGKPCTIIVMVNDISRKYYTGETSWLWDIDFDILADETVKNVVLVGRYVSELSARFALSAVESSKIGYVENVGELYEYIKNKTTGDIYALTCFSDKIKLLQGLEK